MALPFTTLRAHARSNAILLSALLAVSGADLILRYNANERLIHVEQEVRTNRAVLLNSRSLGQADRALTQERVEQNIALSKTVVENSLKNRAFLVEILSKLNEKEKSKPHE